MESGKRGASDVGAVFGGIALLTGLAFTWIQIKETAQHNRDSEIIEDAKLRHEEFARAIDKLANDKHVEVRLAGIYALGQLAHRSRYDFWPVMELLTSWVREHGQRSPGTSENGGDGTDIQAAIKIVAWRETDCDPPHAGQSLDLHGVDLHEYDLGDAQLAGVDLRGTNLKSAHLEGADLRKVVIGPFGGKVTRLDGANLRAADLRDVRFGDYEQNDDDWDGYLTNVSGVTPDALRRKLLKLGAVEEPDDTAWRQRRNKSGYQTVRPRLFGKIAGCLATS